MNFLIWNIKGLNLPLKHKEVKSMIQRHNISHFILLKPKFRDIMLIGLSHV
jgi:hypothetical protein